MWNFARSQWNSRRKPSSCHHNYHFYITKASEEVDRQMVKKGAPRHYDEWQPEYTPKTHKITAKSKRELNEIRAQSIGEKAIDNLDMNDVYTGGAFLGLTFCFKYGVNPAIMGLFQLGQQAVDNLANAWEDITIAFSDLIDGKETENITTVKTRLPKYHHESWMKMTISQLMLEKIAEKTKHEHSIDIFEKLIKKWEAEIEQWSTALIWMREKRDKYYAEDTQAVWTEGGQTESAGDRMQMSIDRMLLQIDNNLSMIYGGDIRNINIDPKTGKRGEYVKTFHHGYKDVIQNLKTEIVMIQNQIDRAIVTKKEAKKIADKLDNLNWIFSMGEAGAFIYLLKSYEVSEIVEHIPGQ